MRVICTLLILVGASAFAMTSMGDVRSDIEHVTRLLYENKAATRGVLMRKKQLFAGAPNISTKENAWLNQMFHKLNTKEEDLHLELQRLVVIALMQQMAAVE